MSKQSLVRSVLLTIAALGLSACATMSHGEDKKEKEENAVKMKFNDCPAAVQATLKKESGGAMIDSVDKETEDGKTIYEADVMVDGKNWELQVREDGQLMKKKLEEAKEEKDEKK